MFFQTAAKVAALSRVLDYFLKMSLEQQDIEILELVYRQVFFSKFRSIWMIILKWILKEKGINAWSGSNLLKGRLLPTQK